MVQLQCLDAHLDTLSTQLYQVNVHVGHIARQQAIMGGFAPEASPLVASDSDFDFNSKDDDDGDDDDASDDDDGDASSIDEMST